jgi:acyl dehydratase
MNSVQLNELTEGMNIPELKKIITQENINLYAEASHDFNPIHIDPEFAKNTPLGGTVAHGMLILSYLSQMMTVAFGQNWLVGGKINVRFKAPARPGDIITAGGRITKIKKEQNQTTIICDVDCKNQNDEIVTTGEAKLRIN